MPFDTVGLDEMLDKLQLEEDRITRNGPAAVKAGADLLCKKMQERAPKRTAQLSQHIKVKGPTYDSIDGHMCMIFPTGKDARGERYETIGYVQEYGRSNMPAQPFMRVTIDDCAPEANDAIVSVLLRD